MKKGSPVQEKKPSYSIYKKSLNTKVLIETNQMISTSRYCCITITYQPRCAALK
jgi:hypothetical protein